jgi:hypothetical protein
MAKLAAGANPNPTPGRKIRPGVVSGIARRTPQEITGGAGVQVQQVGNRLVIKSTATGGGGIGFSVDIVNAFPPIPASGYRKIFLTTDNQLWEAFAGQNRWTACQYATTLDGYPE